MFAHHHKTSTFTWILTLISILLIIFGTVGLVVLQRPLNQLSFDQRGQALAIKDCNESCSSNAQCQVNHFCYQDHCRLADNPSSEICQLQAPPNPSSTAMPKGGPDATLSGQNAPATPAAVIKQPSPSPAIQPNPTIQPSPAPQSDLPTEETALDALLNALHRAGLPVESLPLIALAVGTSLLLIIFVPKIISQFKNKKSSARPQLTTDQIEHPVQKSSMIERVEQKNVKPPQDSQQNS